MEKAVDKQNLTAMARANDPYAMVDPYSALRPANRLAQRLRLALVAAVCLVVLAMLGAGGYLAYAALAPPDISAYARQGVVMVGLSSKPFTISPAELAQLDCVSTSASGTGSGQTGESKAGRVVAWGPALDDFLASYDCALADFRRVRVYCKDGYSVVLRPALLEGQPILSIAAGKEPLSAYQRPLRLVIPGETTGKWAFGVLRMEFER